MSTTRYLFTIDDVNLGSSDIRTAGNVYALESRNAALVAFRLILAGGDPWAYAMTGEPVPMAFGGLLDSPWLTLWSIPAGLDAEQYRQTLEADADPYPDAVLRVGPRGGARWELA